MKKKIKDKSSQNCTPQNPVSAFYGLGFVGALVYYIVSAPNFWAGVLGVLKALVWPAFLVYDLMKYLGM